MLLKLITKTTTTTVLTALILFGSYLSPLLTLHPSHRLNGIRPTSKDFLMPFSFGMLLISLFTLSSLSDYPARGVIVFSRSLFFVSPFLFVLAHFPQFYLLPHTKGILKDSLNTLTNKSLVTFEMKSRVFG